jgi:flagellar FliL protein
MAAEKSDKPAPEGAAAAAPAAEAAAPKGGGIAGFLPLIIALVLAPVISWVVAEFVLLPRFKAQLVAAAGSSGEHAAAPAGHAEAPKAEAHKSEPKAEAKHEAKKPEAKKGGHGGGEVANEGPGSYKYDNVVVNLSGTMGTRYLKTSFLVTGKENLRELFDGRQPQLLDATLNTLGSLTLSDLEEVGSRNLIRARLIAAYNEVLGVRVVEQIYFSDFVIQ